MPRNVDAIAVFLIVAVVLFSGFVIDHGPFCVAHGGRVSVMDDHGFRVIAPRPPRPPRMPAMPSMPTMPQLPRL